MAYIITCEHEGEHCDGAEFCETCKVQIFSGYKDADERYCNDHKPATWDAELAAMSSEEFDDQDEMYWTEWEIDDIFCECPTDCPCRPAPEALQALYDADRARTEEDNKTLTTEAYIAADGHACPGCGDTRFTKYVKGAPGFTASPSRPDRPIAWVHCTECKATWTEEYTLTGYSNFSNEPVPTRPVMVYDPLADISRANYNEPGLHTR